MATAIVREYTPDGFVVAADGRARNSQNGSISSESEQKVFCFAKAQHLAFSFTGSVQLGRVGRVAFDFIQAFELAVDLLPPSRSMNLSAYAELLGSTVQDNLQNVQHRGTIRFTEGQNELEPGGTFKISAVLMDGYFNGDPGRADIHFSHHDQRLRTNIFKPYLNDQTMVHGSKPVADRFFRDPIFEKYKPMQDKPLHFREALSRAIHQARCIIDAQGSPEARAIDDICDSIGGRTHIATVTPARGFSWVSGFEPMAYF